jgi:hypothetical protein
MPDPKKSRKTLRHFPKIRIGDPADKGAMAKFIY